MVEFDGRSDHRKGDQINPFFCAPLETTKPPHFCEGFVLYGAGIRRTVYFGEARFFGRLEFGEKIGVPQLVTINKLAGYGV